jgi:alkylated DNA repair dioxygenase AlkB
MNLFDTLPQRTELDATSWVEHVPGWLSVSDADQLFDELKNGAGWEQRSRYIANQKVIEPRLTAEYASVAEAPYPILHDTVARLDEVYGVTYDGLWINCYRDNRDSTSWHGDWPTCKRSVCTVPVLSLGATRRFFIKPRAGGKSVIFTPEAGDLIVMGGRAQKDWVHSVPKENRPAGMRISVNFSSRAQGVPERTR